MEGSVNDTERRDFHWIEYQFSFAGQRPDLEFLVLLSKQNLIAMPPEGSVASEWTRLDFRQCSVCPLSPQRVSDCPIAFNVSGLLAKFSSMVSHEQADMRVTVAERTYFKRDTIQQGVRSLLGIYMASSGCPHMAMLKPMVRFHLPFASLEESIYRHVTSYLLHQYFDYVSGKRPDIALDELRRRQDLVDQVNRGIIERFQGISQRDANRNALVILNNLGTMVKMSIEERLAELKYLFA